MVRLLGSDLLPFSLRPTCHGLRASATTRLTQAGFSEQRLDLIFNWRHKDKAMNQRYDRMRRITELTARLHALQVLHLVSKGEWRTAMDGEMPMDPPTLMPLSEFYKLLID